MSLFPLFAGKFPPRENCRRRLERKFFVILGNRKETGRRAAGVPAPRFLGTGSVQGEFGNPPPWEIPAVVSKGPREGLPLLQERSSGGFSKAITLYLEPRSQWLLLVLVALGRRLERPQLELQPQRCEREPQRSWQQVPAALGSGPGIRRCPVSVFFVSASLVLPFFCACGLPYGRHGCSRHNSMNGFNLF